MAKSVSSNKAKDNDFYALAGSQRFFVTFGKTKMSFAKVSNLQCLAEFDTIAEGGLNDRVHSVRKPCQQPETLTLEKGLYLDGKDKSNMKYFKAGRSISVPVTIFVLQEATSNNFEKGRGYTFDEGVITKWQLSTLDALGMDVIIETLEISHSGLKEIEIS